MSKTINHIVLDDTLAITERTDGWWLYDKTRGMNLSMKARTKDDAFFNALNYYQHRLTSVETAHRQLREKVDAFVMQFNDEENDND